MSLKGKTVFITGATRGIGREIALRCARDGANIVVTGKTTEPHPRLPGTIHSVAKEVEAAGGAALPIQLDVRDADAIDAAVKQAAATFGSLDCLVNNASAISLTGTLDTPVKRLDLMLAINLRGMGEIGSTFITVLQRYAKTLQAHDSRLMLVGVDPLVRAQLAKTGVLKLIGDENVFVATPQIGEALNQAVAAANAWLARPPAQESRR